MVRCTLLTDRRTDGRMDWHRFDTPSRHRCDASTIWIMKKGIIKSSLQAKHRNKTKMSNKTIQSTKRCESSFGGDNRAHNNTQPPGQIWKSITEIVPGQRGVECTIKRCAHRYPPNGRVRPPGRILIKGTFWWPHSRVSDKRANTVQAEHPSFHYSIIQID